MKAPIGIKSTRLSLLVTIIAIWVGYFSLRTQEMDVLYQQWNDSEWHIDQFARPAPLVRFINAGALGHDGSEFLYLVNKIAVSPALRKVMKLMKKADDDGVVPKILCNDNARRSLKKRVEEYNADVQRSKTLTVIGKLLLYSQAYMSLTNHYGLLEIGMKQEVQDEVVKEPVFIVSLPRTGTTILHRAMAQDKERFRNFDLCDMVCPLPQPIARWDMEGRSKKAEEASGLLNQMKAIYPGLLECLETMHGFRPSEADEDLGWYDTGLGIPYFDPLMKLYPEYRRKENGMSDIESKSVAQYRYAWLAMIMKIYQHTDKVLWEAKKRADGDQEVDSQYNIPHPMEDLPWLMKDPNHSAYLPELLEEFPDAKLIFTHRNPGDIVASMAKLFVIFTSTDFIPGTPGSSAKDWGQETLTRMKHFCNGLVEFTKLQKESNVYSFQRAGESSSNSTSRIDFYFKDIVNDIPGTVKQIYQQFYPDEPPPSEHVMGLFNSYLEGNKREKHGEQRRSLGDFYLTEDDVAFKEYNKMFLSKFDG